MKKVVYLVFLLCLYFILASDVFAKTYHVRIVDINGWADLHSSPYGWSSYSETFYADAILDLVDTTKYEGNWWKVKDPATGKIGYVSANYAIPYINYGDATGSTQCEVDMKNAGFPSSYIPYLCFIKEQHPNWQFEAIPTNLEWASAVQAESNCGISLFYTSNTNYIDSTCSYGYSGWEPPTKEAVAYYLDPRNFLGENFIFQFEYLKYEASLESQYTHVISSIFSGASFYTYHTGKGLDFTNMVLNAGKSTDVNPTFLASRIRQELGSGTSLYNLYSGVTDGYYGLYNFYNIGVSDDCVKQNGTTYCGLTYARNYGWDSVDEALQGGSNFLATKYISVGQYTTYLQKFNVVPTSANKLYLNQYMTNIQAPMSEAKTVYANYRDTNFLNNAYMFKIPVYNNMDTIIDNTGSGATGENPDNDLSEMPVSTLVVSSGFDYTSTTISKVVPETTAETMKGTLEGAAGHGNVVIMDKNENVKTTGKLATGDKISIKSEAGTEVLSVVIYGDTSGDGNIDALDLLQVQKSILGTYSLVDVYSKAADPTKDGVIDAFDLLQVQKNILGTYTIVQ